MMYKGHSHSPQHTLVKSDDRGTVSLFSKEVQAFLTVHYDTFKHVTGCLPALVMAFSSYLSFLRAANEVFENL